LSVRTSSKLRRWPADAFLIAVGLAVLASACGGRPLKFDELAIQRKCAVVQGAAIDRQQALCMAKLAGLKDRKRCPLQTTELNEGEPPEPVFWVREPCTAVGIFVAKSDGRVVAVELDGSVARSLSSGNAQ